MYSGKSAGHFCQIATSNQRISTSPPILVPSPQVVPANQPPTPDRPHTPHLWEYGRHDEHASLSRLALAASSAARPSESPVSRPVSLQGPSVRARHGAIYDKPSVRLQRKRERGSTPHVTGFVVR